MIIQKSATANGDVSLGTTGDSLAGSFQVQITGLAGANITPKRRALTNPSSGGSPVADTSIAVAYKPASSEAFVAAGTPIAADGIYTIISDGFEVLLTVAAFASAIQIDAQPFYG